MTPVKRDGYDELSIEDRVEVISLIIDEFNRAFESPRGVPHDSLMRYAVFLGRHCKGSTAAEISADAAMAIRALWTYGDIDQERAVALTEAVTSVIKYVDIEMQDLLDQLSHSLITFFTGSAVKSRGNDVGSHALLRNVMSRIDSATLRSDIVSPGNPQSAEAFLNALGSISQFSIAVDTVNIKDGDDKGVFSTLNILLNRGMLSPVTVINVFNAYYMNAIVEIVSECHSLAAVMYLFELLNVLAERGEHGKLDKVELSSLMNDVVGEIVDIDSADDSVDASLLSARERIDSSPLGVHAQMVFISDDVGIVSNRPRGTLGGVSAVSAKTGDSDTVSLSMNYNTIRRIRRGEPAALPGVPLIFGE